MTCGTEETGKDKNDVSWRLHCFRCGFHCGVTCKRPHFEASIWLSELPLLQMLLRLLWSNDEAERLGSLMILYKLASGPAHHRVLSAFTLIAIPAPSKRKSLSSLSKVSKVSKETSAGSGSTDNRFQGLVGRGQRRGLGGTIFVQVVGARQLPKMDAHDATDPYVSVQLCVPPLPDQRMDTATAHDAGESASWGAEDGADMAFEYRPVFIHSAQTMRAADRPALTVSGEFAGSACEWTTVDG